MKENSLLPILYSLLFCSLLLVAGRATGYSYDVDAWVRWATYSVEHGLGNVYANPRNDYTPLYQYVLFLYGKWAGSPDSIAHYRSVLKVFTLLFDFAGAILAASLVAGRQRRFLLSLLLLGNIAYLYNTLIWEQVDAIYTFFGFSALLLALRGRGVAAGLCFTLALNMKLQAVLFLPPLALILLPYWALRPVLLVRMLVTAALLQVAILTPFIWGGEQNYLPRIWLLCRSAGDRFPYVSANAFNLWFLLIRKTSLGSMTDTLRFAGLSYKHWGLMMFLVGSAVVLFPLLRHTLRALRARTVLGAAHYPLVFLCCGLLPIVFSYFNTQMHERYWHAALLLLAAYSFLADSYWLVAVTSLAYFLNLEAVMRYLHTQPLWVFSPQLVAGLFTLVLIGGVWQLYGLALPPAAPLVAPKRTYTLS